MRNLFYLFHNTDIICNLSAVNCSSEKKTKKNLKDYAQKLAAWIFSRYGLALTISSTWLRYWSGIHLIQKSKC